VPGEFLGFIVKRNSW